MRLKQFLLWDYQNNKWVYIFYVTNRHSIIFLMLSFFNFWGRGFAFFSLSIRYFLMTLHWGSGVTAGLPTASRVKEVTGSPVHALNPASRAHFTGEVNRKDRDFLDQDVRSRNSQNNIFHFPPKNYKAAHIPIINTHRSEVAICQIRPSHFCLWHFNKWVFSVLY